PVANGQFVGSAGLPCAAMGRLVESGALPPVAIGQFVGSAGLPCAAMGQLVESGALAPVAIGQLVESGALPPLANGQFVGSVATAGRADGAVPAGNASMPRAGPRSRSPPSVMVPRGPTFTRGVSPGGVVPRASRRGPRGPGWPCPGMLSRRM